MEETCSNFLDLPQASFPYLSCLQGKDYLQTSLSERKLDELLLFLSQPLFLDEPEHFLLYSFLFDLAAVFLKTAVLNVKPVGEFPGFVQNTPNFLQNVAIFLLKKYFEPLNF